MYPTCIILVLKISITMTTEGSTLPKYKKTNEVTWQIL